MEAFDPRAAGKWHDRFELRQVGSPETVGFLETLVWPLFRDFDRFQHRVLQSQRLRRFLQHEHRLEEGLRGTAVRRAEALRELIERYRGRWVAVDESGDVVADADELGPLLERLAQLGVTADTVQRVPGIGEPIFVGLS